MKATNRSGSLGEADAVDSLVAMSRLIEWTGERFVPWVSDAPIAYEHVHRYLWAAELVRGRRVLDLGSGEGFGSALLARSASRVQGVDIDPLAVEHARASYADSNLSFEVADARRLDVFEEASFEAVVCFEVIEHLREQEVLLDGVARVLTPDGLLIVSTPDREAYNRTTGEPNDFHERELSEREFRDLLSVRFPHVGLWGQSLAMGSRGSLPAAEANRRCSTSSSSARSILGSHPGPGPGLPGRTCRTRRAAVGSNRVDPVRLRRDDHPPAGGQGGRAARGELCLRREHSSHPSP